MQRVRLLLAIPVACVFACGDATQPAPPLPSLTVPVPSFATADGVPSGAAAFTTCVTGLVGWVNYMADPHFAANDSMSGLHLPYTVFADEAEPPNQCGDLNFTNDRTRLIRSWYATDPRRDEEVPWTYWWWRSRRANNGTSVLDSLRRAYRQPNHFDWDEVPVGLGDEYDAIGTILVMDSNPARAISEAVFEVGDNISFVVQHWAHRTPPTFLSATPSGRHAILTWSNTHEGRSVDSTNIYRDTAYVTTVGPAETSYVDSNLAAGIYAYSLKHISRTVVNTDPMGPAPYPNSPASDPLSVTINDPPEARFGVTCQQLPCTFADSSSDADGTIASWDWTFGDGGSSSLQHPSHTYPAGGDYQVRLIVTDNLGARDTALGWARPLQLAIMGPTLVKPKVTCEWDAFPHGGSGGMTYSWRIAGQEVGTEEYLYWYTGTSGFELTLIGAAGDGQADTAAVSVTVNKNAPTCQLKRG